MMANQRKIVREGAQVRLRIAEERDLDFIVASEAEPENARYIVADSRAYHQDTLDSPAAVHFIVERNDTGAAIGFLMAAGRNSPDHEQYWRRVIINERGKGYGKEALRLLMDWAFGEAGAHRAWLDCKDYNDRALHVYESLGMKREGLLRDTIFVDGKYENLVVLAILEPEWRELKAREKGETS
jgi:RimJ/RimL family protein N-acetyltransferase